MYTREMNFSFFLKDSLWFWSIPTTNTYQIIKSSTILKDKDKWGNILINSSILPEGKISFIEKPIQQTRLVTKTFSVSDYKSMSVLKHYFSEDNYINRRHPLVISFVKKHAPQTNSIRLLLTSLYRAVLDYLVYDNPIPGLYTFTEALNQRRVDCGGFSTLLSSCLQAVGIPTRLVVGYVYKKQNICLSVASLLGLHKLTLNDVSMHAWLEALLPDNTWFPLDPSVEWRRNHGVSTRKGGFGFIPNDRLVVSFGHNHKIIHKGKIHHFAIIQSPIML